LEVICSIRQQDVIGSTVSRFPSGNNRKIRQLGDVRRDSPRFVAGE
jgi:hypothetical protein